MTSFVLVSQESRAQIRCQVAFYQCFTAEYSTEFGKRLTHLRKFGKLNVFIFVPDIYCGLTCLLLNVKRNLLAEIFMTNFYVREPLHGHDIVVRASRILEKSSNLSARFEA